MIVNPHRVELWLNFLFANNKHYIKYDRLNLVSYNPAALQDLCVEELATVVPPSSDEESDDDNDQLSTTGASRY
jgi:hypothetical protein